MQDSVEDSKIFVTLFSYSGAIWLNGIAKRALDLTPGWDWPTHATLQNSAGIGPAWQRPGRREATGAGG